MIYGQSETLFEEFVAEKDFTEAQIHGDRGSIHRQYMEWPAVYGVAGGRGLDSTRRKGGGMICEVCGWEFDPEEFPDCPECLYAREAKEEEEREEDWKEIRAGEEMDRWDEDKQ